MPAVVPLDTLPLVPPRRFGRVLAAARSLRGLLRQDLARSSGGRLTAGDLAAVETGDRILGDAELVAVAALYGVESAPLGPLRTELVVDLDVGVVDPRPGAEILTRYLGLVHRLGGTEVGHPVPLAAGDVAVLAAALGMARPAVEGELRALMADPDHLVAVRARQLDRRAVVPAAGILVAAGRAGALVLEARGDGPPGRGLARPRLGVAGQGSSGRVVFLPARPAAA